MKSTLLVHASLVALLWAGSAHAQGSPTAASNAEDIVVTGSRVITNGNNSPTPVTVVSTEQVQRVQPGNLADTLQILPVFSGSRGSGSNPSSTGSVGAGNGSANQLNLRNLGTTETLVLMDGKRVPPTLISGIVDVDSIPEMMVSRVDVVTGGASAVYGSDAVAGVVNYILDKKLKGLKVVGEAGISSRRDGAKYRLGAAWGADLFDGRGHFEASYQYQKESGVLRRTDREWMRQAGVTGAGTSATNPFVNQVDLRQAGFSAGGIPTLTTASLTQLGYAAGTKLTFNPDGTLRPFVAGVTTGSSAIQIGGDGAYYDSSLLAPLEFNQFFGRFDYDVTDGIHFYVQGAGNLKTNQSYADYLVLQGTTINTQNPFLLQPYRTAFANAGQATFTMNQLAMNGPRLGTISKTSQLNLAAGFNGKIGDFDWTVDYVRGQSILKTTQVNNVNSQYLAEALDATTNGSGQIVCRTALTKTTSCTPFNPFGGAASAASYSYFMRDTHYRAITKLDDVTASVSGSPFETWAGPVKMAVSGEWRLISFSSQSDATPSDFATCTGLPSNCSTTNPPLLWLNTFPASPRISNTVWEGAVEANVPLLKDIPLIQSFDLSGAARYTSYRTSGQYWTWKVGIDWHLTDTLRVRGTRSRDIRAPTLNDLFAPSFVSIVNPTDGLTGLAPRVSGNNFSNPNLKAEVGNTFTVGMVWRPSPKFNVAVDYYNITIRNAITQLQGQTSQIQALCYASDGSSPYCSLQTRANGSVAAAIAAYNANPSSVIGNAAYSPTSWVSQSINLSSIRTMGVDVEANFQSTLFDRPFAARFLAAYQPHIYYSQPGVPTSDQGGAAFGPLGAAAAPTVRLTGMVHFEPVDGIGIDILERWRNPMKLSGVPGEFWVNNHLPAFATTNINIAFKPKSAQAFEFYVNVQNLFDAMPPTGSYTGNGTRAGYRDGYPVGDNPIGRFFTAGVRAKF